jgi:predicted nucleotidyltransferase component of viral defense system
MLTANQLRQVAARSGARDIGNVEIDVILTYLIQLFAEKNIMDHVAFKGGTMLRKIIFGPRGRLSTDLDFTCRSDIGAEDLMLMMLDALERPYHGISFRFDRD